MTFQERLDVLLTLAFCIAGSVCFGIWQNSVAAGLTFFCAVVLYYRKEPS